MYKYILIAMIVSILPLEPLEPAIRRSTVGAEPNYLPCPECVEFSPVTGDGNIPRHFIGANFIADPNNPGKRMFGGYLLSISTEILISSKSDTWHIDPNCVSVKPAPGTLPVIRTQCEGLTVTGIQCSRLSEDGYCWQHSITTPDVDTPTPPPEYVIIRTESGTVYAGTLKNREGKEVTLTEARNIWYYDWSMGMTEMATKGTIYPPKCKLSDIIARMTLTDVSKILHCGKEAKEKLKSAPVWLYSDRFDFDPNTI